MKSKKLKILVVEDKIKGSKNEFKQYLEEELYKKGYNTTIQLVCNYDEFCSLNNPLEVDVLVTDIMIPGGRSEIVPLIMALANDEEKYEKANEIYKKYNAYAIGSYYKISKLELESNPTYTDGVYKDGTYPAGLLVAKRFKDNGRKFTAYTNYAGTGYAHALRGVVFNAVLGEVVPIKDWNSVTEQEGRFVEKYFEASENEREKIKKNLVTPFIPLTGRISLCSGGGKKIELYPEALRKAIEYQMTK